ncbi:MAG: 1-aminocyclopropane-1-carboxylate deaminase/D-cysteine desulfhydrase [Pseudonocardiaceae bacterium]
MVSILAGMMDVALRLPSPLVEICDERMESCGVRLYLKRDDLIHAELPGNKWRKLKYNISAAQVQGAHTLLTFGGAHSNHIRATAAAGHYFGFNTIGIIRGEEHTPLNSSLAYAASRGMRLVYMDRSTYREKETSAVIAGLRAHFGDFYLIPEGGSNALAVKGSGELVDEIDADFDVMCCPCGTGGTLAGISAALGQGQRAVGFSALKGGTFLVDEVAELQRQALGIILDNWTIECEFHFGGFARRKPELDRFVELFRRAHGLTLDWVYVAKMMFGIFTLAERGAFLSGTTIVAVITG